MSLGADLRRLRRLAGLTQESLADRAGVSVDVVKKLEQGRKTSARLPTLHALAAGLGVELTALLGEPPAVASGSLVDSPQLVALRRAIAPPLLALPPEPSTPRPSLAAVKHRVSSGRAPGRHLLRVRGGSFTVSGMNGPGSGREGPAFNTGERCTVYPAVRSVAGRGWTRRRGFGWDEPVADEVDDKALAVFEEHRGILFGVAYRMLGRVSDAEDLVQEAWLRWSGAARDDVAEPRAFLVRIVTRLSIDRLRQLTARRETYVGPWLPEPLPTDRALAGPQSAPDGAERAVLADTVSYAVLLLLESLSPLERAVFVLREAFGLPYAEIAAALGRGEPAVRQLAGRARRHVAERRPRFDVDAGQQRDLTERFLAAARQGDLDGLLAILAPDVRLVGDSGGKAKAPLRVIVGADKVGRFTVGVGGDTPAAAEFRYLDVNGAGALLVSSGGSPFGLLLLGVADGLVRQVYLVTNPDKLGHLSPG